MMMSAAELMARSLSVAAIESGSPAIDGLVGGGLHAGKVYEFYGRSGTYKTQIAMQSALCASRLGVRSVYVDTEGGFRPERMEEVAKSRGWPKSLLDSVEYVRASSAGDQVETIRSISRREESGHAGLVVVDSLTKNFTLDLPGADNAASRQGALNVHLSEMARDAVLGKRVYVLTNRVTFGPSRDTRIGGSTVAQLVSTSIALERHGDRVMARLEGASLSAGLSAGPRGVE